MHGNRILNDKNIYILSLDHDAFMFSVILKF